MQLKRRGCRGLRVILVTSFLALLAMPALADPPGVFLPPAQLTPLPTPARADASASPPVRQVDHKSKGDSSSKSDTADPATPTIGPVLSEAEQITRLQRLIEADQQRMAELHQEITGPTSEYAQAEALYKMLDELLLAKRTEIEQATATGNQRAVAELEGQAADLEKKWLLAQERFNLAIQTRKTLQEQFVALEDKLKQDQLALDKLTGTAPRNGNISGQVAPSPAPSSILEPIDTSNPLRNGPSRASGPPPPADPPATEVRSSPAPATETSPPNLAASPAASPSVAPTENTIAPSPVNGENPLAESPAPAKPVSKELLDAQNEAQLKKEAAAAADAEAKSVSERIAAIEKDIELENKLVVATRKKADIAYQTAQTLGEQVEKRSIEGAPFAEQQELISKRHDAEDLFRKARGEVIQRTNRLNELQSQLASLQREELSALLAAKEMQIEAEQAEQQVTELQNPFSPVNVLQWLLDHGPKILTIVIGVILLRWMVRLTSYRLVSLMVQRGARGTKQEREDRAKTLAGVFHNAGSLTILLAGVLMVCEEIGIAVGPLMGGAAVVGLAVAFGAQNLIRDYFYGFVILLENQYKINDVLKIGEIAGQVEQITLRMTVLRDLEGNVHFIPNGKIDSVTNMTHGWSRALLDVGVSYKEDVDRVMDVLMDLANEMRMEPEYGPHILEAPEMLGVNSFDDSAVVIRFFMKTRPTHKWPVKRELMRRIKHRFDQLGIEIPFPHRIIYHRTEEGTRVDSLGDDELRDSEGYRKSA
jgi:small conductance mechanosensitive channel